MFFPQFQLFPLLGCPCILWLSVTLKYCWSWCCPLSLYYVLPLWTSQADLDVRVSCVFCTLPQCTSQSVPCIRCCTHKEFDICCRPRDLSVLHRSEYVYRFPFWVWTVLIWRFTRSLLILLPMTCWYGIMAVSVGFLSCNCGFWFGCRVHLMSLLLYPFCWKTCFGHCSSSLTLLESHSAPSCLTTMASTARFCARLFSNFVYSFPIYWVSKWAI